jgi:hypothetical protein
MGNRSKQGGSSKQSSVKYNSSTQSSSTDSRQYTNIDTRGYTNIDSRKYTNIDSRNLSTNINNADNRSISQIGLDCGVSPKDVENYKNNQSININQDNSQNIVVAGSGNTMENITQQMNLTSYGPEVKKCMQDAVTNIQSQNQNVLKSKNKNVTSSKQISENKIASKTATSTKNENINKTDQKSDSTQKSTQKNSQTASASQTAGMGSFNFDLTNVFIFLAVMALIALVGFVSLHIINSKKE